RERTVTISGASKTFSVTGWRIGTIVAPPRATDAIRKVHDFLTVGAPAPLQEAVAVALETLGPDYYETLVRAYRTRRDLLHGALVDAGFRCRPPEGAYYILADFAGLSDLADDEFARWLTCEVGVAPARARSEGGVRPWNPSDAPYAPAPGRRRPARRRPTPLKPAPAGRRARVMGRRRSPRRRRAPHKPPSARPARGARAPPRTG